MLDRENKEAIVLLGGGGHCRSCIEVIETDERFFIAGIIDPNLVAGSEVSGYPVLGGDEQLEELRKSVKHALVTVGQIKNSDLRKSLAQRAASYGYSFPVIIASSAIVSKHSQLGEGTIIMHKAFVNTTSSIGSHCIVNTFALIEHDCTVGDFVHLSTGSILNGGVTVGNNSFIGSGTIVRENALIGNNVCVGAGSLILHTIQEQGIYLGNPAIKQ